VKLDLEAIRAMTGGQIGITDIPCRLCGPSRSSPHNRTRKVMRVWDDCEFVTYSCVRCGTSGYAKAKGLVAAVKHLHPADAKHDTGKIELARRLWSRSIPQSGTPAESYLRSRDCWIESENIRYLPPQGCYGPTMIARFGNGNLTGVHLTRLAPDGKGKAGTEKDKIMIGPSKGQPIILHDNPESLELLVTEGIEDAASLAIATGWTTWAAASATRIPHVVAKATSFDRVLIAVDADFAGQRALQCAREVRPDVIALDFASATDWTESADANAVMIRDGAGVILDCIDRAVLPTITTTSEMKGAA
jgi:Toprim domain